MSENACEASTSLEAGPRSADVNGTRTSAFRSGMLFPSTAIVRRELLSHSRRLRPVLCLLLVLASMMTLLVNWPTRGVVEVANPLQGQGIILVPGSGPSAQMDLVRMARLTRDTFMTHAMILLSACMLFVPALAAGSVSVEKERRTFEQLYLTLIRPMGMLAAKLVSAIAAFLVVLVGALPVIAPAVFFGVGLDWWEFAVAFLVLLSTACVCGAIGLISAAYCRGAMAGLFIAYGLAFLLLGGITMVFLFVPRFIFGFRYFPGGMDGLAGLLSFTSPHIILDALGEGRLSTGFAIIALAYQSCVITVCFALAARFLRTRSTKTPPVSREAPIDDPMLLAERRRKFPYYLVDPLKRRRPISDGSNPMAARELNWGIYNKASSLIRVFYVSFAVFSLGAASAVYVAESANGAYLWLALECATMVFAAPTLLAGTFAKEYEHGNIDMIRMTLLTPWEIVLGKVVAGALALAPVFIAAVVANVFMLTLGPGASRVIFRGIANLFVYGAFALSIGIMVSMLTRRTVTAITVGYLATTVCVAVMPFLAGILFQLVGEAPPLHGYGLDALFAPILGDVSYPGPTTRTIALSFLVFRHAVYLAVSSSLIFICVIWFDRFKKQDR